MPASTVITPAGTAAKNSSFITRSVEQANIMLSALAAMKEMRDEVDILGLGAQLADGDFVDNNNHIDKAALVAFFQTVAAVIALMQANNNAHYKNLYSMKR